MTFLLETAEYIFGPSVGPIETIVIYICAYTLFLVLLDALMRLFEFVAGLFGVRGD